MKKVYTKKQPSKKILNKYKDYFYEAQSNFSKVIEQLEIRMAIETKIPDIEFIFEGGCVGIGNMSRTMKLWSF